MRTHAIPGYYAPDNRYRTVTAWVAQIIDASENES